MARKAQTRSWAWIGQAALLAVGVLVLVVSSVLLWDRYGVDQPAPPAAGIATNSAPAAAVDPVPGQTSKRNGEPAGIEVGTPQFGAPDPVAMAEPEPGQVARESVQQTTGPQDEAAEPGDQPAAAPFDTAVPPQPSGGEAIVAGAGQGQPPAPQPETGTLSITGRVLVSTGEPVAGITVTASPLAGNRRSGSPAGLRSLSGPDGSFRFDNLLPGDYRLVSPATDRFPEKAVTARAGLKSADIVLEAIRRVRIYGTVTDGSGQPLEGVEVSFSSATEGTATDASGNYEQHVQSRINLTNIISYELEGHQGAREMLAGRDLENVNEKRIDVTLPAIGETFNVAGAVRDERGDPVDRATIWLESASAGSRFRGSSDDEGKFSIEGVQPGEDYRLTVVSRGQHARYSRQPVPVTADVLGLDIVLESIGTGRVSGYMSDPLGYPVTDVNMTVRSRKNPSKVLAVEGNSLGYFEVEGVPAGELVFSTRSYPQFNVSGAELAPGGSLDVNLVLDWGTESLAGRVVDAGGQPRAGVDVSLIWDHRSGEMTSNSSRRTVTDEAGRFRFSELGQGIHRVNIAAPEFQPVRIEHNVGFDYGEIEVVLEPR